MPIEKKGSINSKKNHNTETESNGQCKQLQAQEQRGGPALQYSSVTCTDYVYVLKFRASFLKSLGYFPAITYLNMLAYTPYHTAAKATYKGLT